MSNTTLASNKTSTETVKALTQLLADSYALMGQTHLAHWNVEGPAFFTLHAAFQTQYEELFTAVDDLAERIRALDSYSPGGLKTFSQMSSITEMETGAAPAKDFVAHLIDGHEIVVAAAKTLRDSSAKEGDLETQDVAIGRIQIHEKTLWMLRSYLKNL
ncbi:MAG: Dps family protein [Verrucomicrobiales bacterium]